MMFPIVTDVAHAGLTVPDLHEAISMWCSELGFTLERSFTLDEETTAGTTGVVGATLSAATVRLGHHRIELLQYDPPGAQRADGSPAHEGTIHIALTVTDLDRALEVFARHGWHAVGTPHLMTNGTRAGTRIVYLAGEHGGFVELIAPPPAA